MDDLMFVSYSAFVLVLFVCLTLLECFMEFVLQNWDTIMLLVTNLIAYFVPSPRQRKK